MVRTLRVACVPALEDYHVCTDFPASANGGKGRFCLKQRLPRRDDFWKIKWNIAKSSFFVIRTYIRNDQTYNGAARHLSGMARHISEMPDICPKRPWHISGAGRTSIRNRQTNLSGGGHQHNSWKWPDMYPNWPFLIKSGYLFKFHKKP